MSNRIWLTSGVQFRQQGGSRSERLCVGLGFRLKILTVIVVVGRLFAPWSPFVHLHRVSSYGGTNKAARRRPSNVASRLAFVRLTGGVLDVADGLMRGALCLVDFAFHLHLLVARDLAERVLDSALRLSAAPLTCSLSTIFSSDCGNARETVRRDERSILMVSGAAVVVSLPPGRSRGSSGSQRAVPSAMGVVRQRARSASRRGSF